MRNRAKCKLCQSIIESFHQHDYVTCKCEEISIDGGTTYFRAMAKNWGNFLRIDDLDNEIVVTVKDKDEPEKEEVKPLYNAEMTREDKLKMLDEMIKSYETLPKHAIEAPITGYDLVSLLLLVKSLLS